MIKKPNHPSIPYGTSFKATAFRARALVRTGVVATIVAWSGAMGASYGLGQGTPAFGPLVVGVITLVGAVFFACLAILANIAYDEYLTRPPRRGRLSRFAPQWQRRSVVRFSLVMAVFWLPWLIALYPGGAYWDTYYQIQQVFPENHPISIIPFGDHGKDTITSAYFCDHHPLLDTLLYGGFAAASQALTGGWNAGSFAFVILQAAATIVALTASVAYLRKLGAPSALCFAAFAFFCVMPFISTWALTMVKDSLFSFVYIPYFMMLVAAVATRGRSLERGRSIALFIGLGVLLCLTKKTGMYVVIPTALFACAATLLRIWHAHKVAGSRSYAPRLLAAFGGQAVACLLVMTFLLPWVVFPALDVAPGGRQESLGVALQQTAAFVHEHRDEVTPEEMAAIDAVIPYGRLIDDYDPLCQDGAKYHFRLDASPQAVHRYLEVWAQMGLRHPDTYLGAVFTIGGGYLSPCQSLNIRTTTCDTWQGDAHVLYNPEGLNWLREGLAALYDSYASLPVICLPVQAVVWVFWLPALLWLVARRHHPGDGLLFVPGAIVLAFCIIGPIFDARYCLPLLYTVPLMACFVFRGRPAERLQRTEVPRHDPPKKIALETSISTHEERGCCDG